MAAKLRTRLSISLRPPRGSAWAKARSAEALRRQRPDGDQAAGLVIAGASGPRPRRLYREEQDPRRNRYGKAAQEPGCDNRRTLAALR